MKEYSEVLHVITAIENNVQSLAINLPAFFGSQFKNPLIWAIETGKKLDGKDPIIWTIETGKKLGGKDPIIWAVDNNKNIDGKDPIIWTI